MVDIESVETYKPSGKCTAKGMATVIGLGLGGTMLACLLIYLVWGVIPYLGIVFAALLGLSVGVSVLFGVRLGKCRLPLAAGTVGLALGLSGYMGLHYMNFCSIVQSWRTSAERQLGDASRDGDLVTACVKEQLTEEWGGAGFGAYVRSWRKGTWGSSWVIVLMQALWAVELIVVGALAAGIPFLASQDPFCEPCGRWCDHEQLLVASLDAREEVLGACRPETIGKLNEIETVSENLSRCVVELAYCSA